ncbi:MAG: DNA/RNA nuclease SfsA [Xanthomonadales bacterium]|nr:DNA/RNA nuclease SfsA [Xanthomonadales bacterium]
MLIPHATPLQPARLVQRYDRFIADVEREDGEVVSAHCVNPGRMEGLIRPGAPVWISPAPEGSKRKLRWTLELMEIEGQMVGANTVVPNRIAEALVRARLIPGLRRWRSLEREVPYGEGSRIDLMLRGARDHLVEVKNCHLVYPDRRAYFPDSVSVRAAKHLHELVEEVRQGRKATVLFILQRTDGRALRPSQLHDPAFAAAAREAGEAGVRFRAARIQPTPEGFRFQCMIPVDLSPYDESRVSPFRDDLAPWSGWRRRGKRQR